MALLDLRRLATIAGLVMTMPILSGVARTAEIDMNPAQPVVDVESGSLTDEADTDTGPLNQAVTEKPVEVIKERYPNGKVKILREVTLDEQGNYILHGEWKMWDEQGNLIAAGRCRNNVRHGTWTRLLRAGDATILSQMPYKQYEGSFTSQATFKDGKLHGTWIIFDNKQRKISEWEYADGLRHGLRKWTYASGHPMREITYHEGLLDGQSRAWDTNSRLIVDETYQQGRKLAVKVDHDDDGNKRSEGMFLHAQYVIDQPVDWWNAGPCTYKTIGQDVKHGRFSTWFSNGQKSKEGMYDGDLANGQFTWWYPNGQERMSGAFKSDKQHGSWVWWHENGQKASQGQYIDGQPTGVWTFWTDAGRLSRKADFSEETGAVAAGPDTSKETYVPQAETSRNIGSEPTAR